MKVRGIVIANVLVLGTGASVVAQTPAAAADAGVFIDGTVGADYDQTDFEPPGPAMAAGFGIGARLWKRFSLRFEFDFPGDHLDLQRSDSLEHRFVSRTTSYAFLFARHFRRQSRIQVVTLAGVSALTHRSHFTGFIDIRPRDGSAPTHTVFDDRDVEQWVALALGVETPITITRHLQVVPQFRTHQVANSELGQLFPSGKSLLRPRLAARWQF
ncbi:MAG TPA: hypothetical protein VFU28_20305 [Vicinamibacterales bacterium]|nr:hypothetical protein [Vicinamibacterales bacterium]